MTLSDSKIFNDIESRAASLRQLSFFYAARSSISRKKQ